MNDFLELTVGALASGCIYALAALSYLLAGLLVAPNVSAHCLMGLPLAI